VAKLQLLVVDWRSDWYAASLRDAFPEVEIATAGSFPDAGPHLAEAEILVTLGVRLPGLDFTDRVAAQMPRLAWVQCLASGYEAVKTALAARGDVLITTGAGIHGPQVSEMALLHMLTLARGMRTMLRNQAAVTWERVPQRILASKTVGIVGMGTIGTHLAGVCKALGMRVYGFSRTIRPVPGVDRMLPREELPGAALELDFLVLVVPAAPDTSHLVDAALLAAMKPTAYLINLGRGPAVDEDALAEALQAGTIAGAGLDVFAAEPLPPDSPLWRLENVIITPHVGGYHDLYAEQTLAFLQPNLRAFVDGRRDEMINVVS
jgi:D-2-hydroxyacid dehydrogenase (NADP+)